MLTVAMLILAVLAISSSAILVRWAAIPAVSLAFWRTAGGAIALAPAAHRSSSRLARSDRRSIAIAGIALGVHFAAWMASLTLTSVASSVTLVSTAPIMIASFQIASGKKPSKTTLFSIGLAALGTAILAVTDARIGGTIAVIESDGGGIGAPSTLGRRPQLGNALALVGAAAIAVYLSIGDRLRQRLSTAAYAGRTYAIAAIVMAPIALAFGRPVIAPSTGAWLAILAMILGPQLVGHTSLNYLLGRLGSLTVSLSLLAEPIGASLLVLLFLGERPTPGAWFGAPIILAGVALQLVAGSSRRTGGPQ